MVTEATSPLTGDMAELERNILADHYYYVEEIGNWGMTDTARDRGFRVGGKYWSEDLKLGEKDTLRIVALARSLVWLAQRSGRKRPFFMTQPGIRSLNQDAKDAFDSGWAVVSPESLWSDLQALTFQEKSMRTLTNLTLAEPEVGSGVRLPLQLSPYPGAIRHDHHEDSQTAMGLLYGCTDAEGLLVLQHLKEQGLIVEGTDGDSFGLTLYIKPAGYALADQLRVGSRMEVRQAFLVCRFNGELDQIFASCYKPAGDHQDVRCPVSRVKDVHHVDRIDDKIVRMIEESTIVIVDLTEQNFNVAFEAGYALSLRKPIVWTLKDDGTELKLPFDIQSQNILRWKPDELPEFHEALKYRMLAALDKAAANNGK